MKNHRYVVWCLVSVLAIVSIASAADSGPRRGGGGMYGDWLLKTQFQDRQMESILTFDRNAEGNRTAYLISFWGMTELTDVTFEDGRLTFTQTRQGRDGQTMTSKFTGTIADGKLTGTLTSDRGELKVEGARRPRMPRAAGTWNITFSMGEREISTALVITADAEGNLKVAWPSERVTHEISDVTYERGAIGFKTKSSMEDRQWESTFAGRIEGDTLTGTLTSTRGETEITGTRAGAAAIGRWNLEITSENGARKQRLVINPDLSALYGALPIKKVTVAEDKVSFKIELKFGEQTFEMDFAGTLKDGKLTGELTSARGTQKVTGAKVVRMQRQRPAS